MPYSASKKMLEGRIPIAAMGLMMASSVGLIGWGQTPSPEESGGASLPAAVAPSADEESIVRWIRLLGSSQYEDRENATRILSQLEAEMLPLLERELGKVTDPEVRVRLSAVLAKLKYERQQRIIRAFLRDSDMNHDHGLGGWSSFSAVAGATRSSKRLFLQLSERYPELVEEKLETPQAALEWARRVAISIQQDQVQRGEGDKSDGLALLYCMCAANPADLGGMPSVSVRTFLRSPYNQFLRDPQAKKPMEALSERWGALITNSSDQTMSMLILLESELTSVRNIAKKMLEVREGPDAAEARDILIALQVMFRFGKPEDIPLLERWLDDTEVCDESVSLNVFSEPNGFTPGNDGAGRNVSTVEVRDAAILACMQISAMDYRKHFPGIVMHELRGYLPRTIASSQSAEDVRAARIQAWRQFTAAKSSAPVPRQ
jgi:hypothetical protein